MAHYKIKNITGKLPKRHVNKDMLLKIEYHVGFQKKFSKLGVDEEILLTCRTLPVSIHNLRAKNLIIISEISENEFARLQKPSARKPAPKPVNEENVKLAPVKEEEPIDTVEKTTTNKTTKKSSKKKIESTVVVKNED